MRISDWSSDVCSSDLVDAAARHFGGEGGAHVIIETLVAARGAAGDAGLGDARVPDERHLAPRGQRAAAFDRDDAVERGDRKSVGWGKGVSVRVDLGGRRVIKQKTSERTPTIR